MGSGQAISFGVLLISLLVISSMIYGNIMQSNEMYEKDKEESYERESNILKTNMQITNYSLAADNSSYSVILKNTGLTIWENPEKFDILSNLTNLDSWNYTYDVWIPYRELNGSISSETIYWNYTIEDENSINPYFIDPDESLNITIHATDKNLFARDFWVRIISDNGVLEFSYVYL